MKKSLFLAVLASFAVSSAQAATLDELCEQRDRAFDRAGNLDLPLAERNAASEEVERCAKEIDASFAAKCLQIEQESALKVANAPVSTLINTDPPAKKHGMAWKVAKYAVCPLYVLGGYGLGHALGGFFGAAGGVQLWQEQWNR